LERGPYHVHHGSGWQKTETIWDRNNLAAPLSSNGNQYAKKCAVSTAVLLMSDSKETELCTYLSAILPGGLLLNALVPIIAKEGIEALRGET
jgi:hypothetical protein